MAYHFEEDEAVEFGDREAILIYNFRYWIRKNKANGKNFYDGRTWTYNKLDAFPKLFRFWSPDRIRRLIDNLVEKGVLLKGNYNQTPHDRTCWYAFTDEDRFLRELPKDEAPTLETIDLANLPNANGKNTKSSWQNDKIHLAEAQNPTGGNANCIEGTNNKPNNKPDFISLPPEEKKEFLKKAFLEKKLKSDPEKYFLFREKDFWKGVKNLEADIAWWENGHKEKFPELHIEKSADDTNVVSKKSEPEEIKNLRSQIKSYICRADEKGYLDYDLFFMGKSIEKTLFGFVIKVDDERALKYQPALNKINVKIEANEK